MFLRQLPSELVKQISSKTIHMFRSECHLKLHVQNLGYPLPLKLGAQKSPIFGVFCQLCHLTATLVAYIFEMKDDIAIGDSFGNNKVYRTVFRNYTNVCLQTV